MHHNGSSKSNVNTITACLSLTAIHGPNSEQWTFWDEHDTCLHWVTEGTLIVAPAAAAAAFRTPWRRSEPVTSTLLDYIKPDAPAYSTLLAAVSDRPGCALLLPTKGNQQVWRPGKSPTHTNKHTLADWC
jgi:hypothetical protein